MLTSTPKLLGLDNRKMSKSFNNYIAFSDKPDTVKKKVMSMITDPQKIRLDDPGHPDIWNLYSYYSVFKPEKARVIKKICPASKRGCIKCKKELAEILIEKIEPIRKKREKLLGDKVTLLKILKKGDEKAKAAAGETMKEVRNVVGVFHDL